MKWLDSLRAKRRTRLVADACRRFGLVPASQLIARRLRPNKSVVDNRALYRFSVTMTEQDMIGIFAAPDPELSTSMFCELIARRLFVQLLQSPNYRRVR